VCACREEWYGKDWVHSSAHHVGFISFIGTFYFVLVYVVILCSFFQYSYSILMFLFILIIRLVSSARIPKALHGLNPLNLIVAVTLKSYIA
jgi:glucan phosphoethanolaminetransferase (alkaline phosphatase superfamily)